MASSQAEGLRQDALVKERAKAREEFERQKQALINETEKARPSTSRFIGQNDSMEDSLKKSTVGLVRLEDFQQRRKELEELKALRDAITVSLSLLPPFALVGLITFGTMVRVLKLYAPFKLRVLQGTSA